MRERDTNHLDPQALALSVLTWLLQDDARRDRFLALTGIEASDIRDRLADSAFLDAVLGFLEGHEPDLLACADELGLAPDRLVTARRQLL